MRCKRTNLFIGDVPTRMDCTVGPRPFLSMKMELHRRFSVLFLVGILGVWLGIFLPQNVHAQRIPQSAESTFSRAYQMYANQLYAQAAHAFHSFRTDFPHHPSTPEALYYEAEASLALGRLDDSVALFRTFERTYPAHPLALQARLALGQHFYEAEDYTRAIETLQGVLEDEPPAETGAKALYWMGEAAQQQGDLDQALSFYRQAANEYLYTDTAPLALYAIAFIHVQQDNYEEAVDAFELLTARYPESPYARNIGLALAEVYYELNDFERVVEEIDKRLPRLDEAAFKRATFLQAEAYTQLRDSESAIVVYNRFVEEIPESPFRRRALYGLAWNYHFARSYEWAADHFAQVREGFSDDLAMEATYYEAVNRKLNGKPGVAADLFLEVADRWPSGEFAAQGLFEKGIADYELRQWQKASDAFSRLIETYVYSDLIGEALRLRGYTNIALNDYDEALQDFDQAIALDAAPGSLKEDVLFQKAWLLYRSGRYSEAVTAFRNVLDENPRGSYASEALFWTAESNYQLGQFSAATTLFREYLDVYPGGRYTDAAHYALGWSFFRQGRYREATAQFAIFVRDYRDSDESIPYRTDALLRLADSYYALKNYPQAIDFYQRIGDAGGDYALYQIGQAYYNANDAFEAITTFRELLDTYPQSNWREEAQYSLGYLYFLNQDYDQAVTTYEQLISTFPRHALAAKAQYGIGDAYFNAEQPEAAIEAYRTVLERYPDSPFVTDAAAGMLYALAALNDEARANAIIDDFAAQHPNSPIVQELRFRQAEVRYQSGQLEDALGAFQEFASTSGNPALVADAQFFIGSIQLNQGNIEAALAALAQSVQSGVGTHTVDAASLLGSTYEAEERHEEAYAAFQRMEALAVDNVTRDDARYRQGIVLIALGRTEEAATLLESTLDQGREDASTPQTQLGIAKVYEATNRPADAMRLYQRIISQSRDDVGAEALYLLGDLLMRRGEARVAIGQLTRMPTLFEGFPEWNARGYLLQARAFTELGEAGEAARLYDLVIDTYSGTEFANEATRAKSNL